MDVDVKSSLGPYGAGGNPKKRPISFRLTVPSKRQSLPYHQRSSAATSHTFYVSKDGSAEPDTPSSITDEDPFYDSDAEPVALFLSNEFESPFSQSFEQVEREKKPRFTKPVMLGPSLSSSDNSASPGASSYRPLFRSPDSVLERLEKAYEVVESNDLFKDSPLWQALLEAKKSGPEDPRFTPKIMEKVSESISVSVILKLHPSGFSFNDSEQMYPYVRNYVSVMDAINYGILVGQLETSLPKTLATTVDGVQKPAVLQFYDGGIVVEVHDLREGRAMIPTPGAPAIPTKTKLFLRPDHHGILHFMDNQPAAPRVRYIVEQHLIWYLHPDLHLKPDTEETAFLWSLHNTFLQANVPYKSKLTKRRNALVPARTKHTVPSAILYTANEATEPEDLLAAPSSLISTTTHDAPLLNNAHHASATNETTKDAVPKSDAVKSEENDETANKDSDTLMDTDVALATSGALLKHVPIAPQALTRTPAAVSTKKSKLFSHLQSINFSPDYHKEADTGQSHSEKKRPYSDRADPNLKEAVLSHPQVVGHFLFTIQPRYPVPQANPQTPLDYATLEINNRSAGGSQPFEMMHTSLRYSSGKALHFQSGGPAATQRLLNQFKKLETPATNEQVKSWQTPNRLPNQGAPGPQGAPGMGPQGQMVGGVNPAQHGHPHAHPHGPTTPQGMPGPGPHPHAMVPHSPAGMQAVGTPGGHHPMTPGGVGPQGPNNLNSSSNAMSVDSPSQGPPHGGNAAPHPNQHMAMQGMPQGARAPMNVQVNSMRSMVPQSMPGGAHTGGAHVGQAQGGPTGPGAGPQGGIRAKQVGHMGSVPIGAPPAAHVPGTMSMYPMKQTAATQGMMPNNPNAGAPRMAQPGAKPMQPGMPGATVVGGTTKYGAQIPVGMQGAPRTAGPGTTKFAVGPHASPVGAPRPISVKATAPIASSPSGSPGPSSASPAANRRTTKKK